MTAVGPGAPLMPRSSRPSPYPWLPLALICALGGVLRLSGLGHQSLWMDEVVTVLSSRTSLMNILISPPADPNVPPLYYLLMWALRGLGQTEAALRLPSALSGVLSIPILYAITARWLGRRIALLSALLLALSPIHLWYSQEARPYSLLVLIGLIAVWCLQRALDAPGSLWRRWAFAVSAAATFYVHTVAIAFIAALWASVLLIAPRRELRSWVATFMVSGLLCVPGVYLLLLVPPVVTANPSYQFNPSHLAYTLWTYATGFSLGPTLTELRLDGLAGVRRHGMLVAPVLGTVLVLLAVGVHRLWVDARRHLLTLLLWVVCPIGFVVLGALMTDHPYNVRYTVLALPPVLVLLAVGADRLPTRALRLGVGAAVTISTGAALWNYYTNPRYFRDDNRGAAAFLRAHVEPHDLVIASAAYTTQPLHHYLGDTEVELVGYPTSEHSPPDAQPVTGRILVDSARVGTDLAGLVGERRGFWLFLSRTFHSDPDGHLERYADTHYHQVGEYVGPGVRVLRYVRPDIAALLH